MFDCCIWVRDIGNIIVVSMNEIQDIVHLFDGRCNGTYDSKRSPWNQCWGEGIAFQHHDKSWWRAIESNTEELGLGKAPEMLFEKFHRLIHGEVRDDVWEDWLIVWGRVGSRYWRSYRYVVSIAKNEG